MKFGELLTNERELILRSLALCGLRVITPLSNAQGRLKLSGVELEEQEIQEIHLLDSGLEGITHQLSELGFVLKGEIGKWSVYVHPEEILHEQPFDGIYRLGHLVLINFGNDKGLKAFVYSVTEEEISLISETGWFYLHYTQKPELDQFTFLRDTLFRYQFKDDLTTATDYSEGLFKHIF